jgi:hypothetical protein
MWCWRPAQLDPQLDTYKVVVSLVGQMTARAGSFIITSHTNVIWLLAPDAADVGSARYDMVAMI